MASTPLTNVPIQASVTSLGQWMSRVWIWANSEQRYTAFWTVGKRLKAILWPSIF